MHVGDQVVQPSLTVQRRMSRAGSNNGLISHARRASSPTAGADSPDLQKMNTDAENTFQPTAMTPSNQDSIKVLRQRHQSIDGANPTSEQHDMPHNVRANYDELVQRTGSTVYVEQLIQKGKRNITIRINININLTTSITIIVVIDILHPILKQPIQHQHMHVLQHIFILNLYPQ